MSPKITITPDDPELRAMLEKMVADAGGLEAFLKQAAERRELSSRMARKSASLRELYPDQFVAMTVTDELIAADTLDELLSSLREKGIPRSKYVIEFLDVEWGPMVV